MSSAATFGRVGSGFFARLGARFSDRFNPILVREVQQATSGKTFVALMALSLFAVLVITLVVGTRYRTFGNAPDLGRETFTIVTGVLSFLAVFIVPMQSFQSMRQEVGAGVSEQLALTRLGPWRIVLGKTLAGLAVFFLYFSTFAPLVAMCYLLRGIDVLSIGFALLVLTALSVLANLGAIAAATIGKNRSAQSAIQLGAAIGLGWAAITLIELMASLPRNVGRIFTDWDVAAAVLVAAFWIVAGGVLAAMVATASLAHEYEDRSSRFRLFAVVLAAVGPGTLLLFNGPPHDVFFEVCSFSAFASVPFWAIACCEKPGLSPRVAAHAPTTGWWLAAPFLPGSGLGIAFTLLLAVVSLVAANMYTTAITPVFPGEEFRLALASWCYVMFYAACFTVVRHVLRRSPNGTNQTAVLVVGFAILVNVLPVFVLALLGPGPGPDWSVLFVLNPFFTAWEARNEAGPLVCAFGLGCLGLVVLARFAPRALREVGHAAQQRIERQRAAESDAAAARAAAAAGAQDGADGVAR